MFTAIAKVIGSWGSAPQAEAMWEQESELESQDPWMIQIVNFNNNNNKTSNYFFLTKSFTRPTWVGDKKCAMPGTGRAPPRDGGPQGEGWALKPSMACLPPLYKGWRLPSRLLSQVFPDTQPSTEAGCGEDRFLPWPLPFLCQGGRAGLRDG